MIEPANWAKKKVVEIVAHLTPHCHDITRLLSESSEHTLPLRTRLLIRLHFCVCIWCRRYREHLKLMRKLSAKFPEKGCEEGANLSIEARERLNRALQKARR
jgi:hypothetical protein